MALTQRDRAIVAAAADTMFPAGGAFDADGDDAGVVDYVDDYLERLPRLDRMQLLAFFRLFDAGLAWSEKNAGARFHTADSITRREYLSSWENSPSYTRRMGFQGMRMVLTMAYTEHPDVKLAMGLTPPTPNGSSNPRGRSAQAGGLPR